MNKKIKKIFLVLILFLFVGLNLVIVKADSGFDASYGGGGSSSSHSSSHSSHSHSSSHSSHSHSSSSSDSSSVPVPKEVSIVFGIYFITLFISAFLISAVIIIRNILYVIKEGKREKEENSDISDDIINQVYPRFNKEKFKEKAFSIYKDVQEGWMDFDYDKLRSLLSDEMFNMYKSQLETLKIKGQQNIMKDFKLYDVYIKGIRKENDNIIVDTKLCVSCIDYIIDSNKEVIEGDDWFRPYYEYELTFLKSKTIKENNICPNCGAKLNNQQSNKCEHCNSIVISNKYDWILISKRMIN